MARGKSAASRKVTSLILLVLIIAIVSCGVFVALNGFGQGKMVHYMKPWGEAISLGLDLRGGVYTVYRAIDNGEDDFAGLVQSTADVMLNRLTQQGFTEATVTLQGTDRIRIEIPDVSDPNEILDIIGTPAHLTFEDEAGNVVMEGKEVRRAEAGYQENLPVVLFQLTAEGTEQFAKATAANLNKTIAIKLDGEIISQPRVESVISGGSGSITGSGSIDEAKNLAVLIQSGALPLQLEQLEVSAISASLGVEALDKALLAGIIGVILVMLFMLLRYRLPGLVADMALVIYVLLVVLLLALTGAQLTLPGVAGIVLGIGMAVDANVIIFERFREEVRNGRHLRAALKYGFKNALSAIMDSNITTIIAALVLMAFGTGSVKGFAITLLISVITSLFTAVFVSRGLLWLFVNLDIRKMSLYNSVKKRETPIFKVKDRSKVCLMVSGAILAVALIMSIAGFGLNLGIDFTGGILMEYNMGGDFDVDDIRDALGEQGIDEAQIAKAGEDQHNVQIRIKDVDNSDEMREALEESLRAKYPDIIYVTVDRVGAIAGRTLINNAIMSLVVAWALMLVYIAIRFDLYSGLAAVFGLLHDVLLVVAAMVLLRGFFQINSTFIAALLTIVGYSINNTIVIMDRIRENTRKPLVRNLQRSEIVSLSVQESLTRTVSTTLTTLMTTVSLFILGVPSIREFSMPLIIGMLSGVYSSNFITGYVWAYLMDHRGWLKRRRSAAKAQS